MNIFIYLKHLIILGNYIHLNKFKNIKNNKIKKIK